MLNNVQIVNFDQSLEKQVVELWNQELSSDTVTLERFRKQVLWDDNFDPSLALVAKHDNEPLGFLLATKRKFPYLERGLEPDLGWINVMFVRSDARQQGIGSALLSEAEARLQALGAKKIILAAYSPGYFFRGVDGKAYPAAPAFFEAHGYLPGEESYRMCRDLYAYQPSEAEAAARARATALGYCFTPYDASRSLELLSFAAQEFGGGWKRNCLLAMREGTAEDRIILVLDPDNKICGFCTRAIDDNPMRFGPIGIAEHCRDAGLGGVLLSHAMEEMEKRGIHHMFFLSTDAPGRRFYERHGFKVVRTFTGYSKTVEWQEGVIGQTE